jgi:hypothetical protein
VWIAGSALGIAILSLPDTGPRVVSFSDDHGPSGLDALGIAVVVAAWLPVASLLWRGRRALAGRDGRACGGLAVVGIVATIVTIALDLGQWWALAVVILVAAQVWALAIISARGTDQDEE